MDQSDAGAVKCEQITIGSGATFTTMNIQNLLLASIGPLGTPEIIIILVLGAILALVAVLPFWFICKKAGLSPWLSCLMIVPFGAVVLPFILAFIDWPSLKRDTTP